METKQKTKVLKEIKSLWSKINYIINDKAMSKYGSRLFEQTFKETKEHDRFRGDNIRGMTLRDEARFFAVKRICEYLYIANNTLKAEDFNHIQTSCFVACSIASEFNKELKDIIPQETALNIIELDYCELIAEGD